MSQGLAAGQGPLGTLCGVVGSPGVLAQTASLFSGTVRRAGGRASGVRGSGRWLSTLPISEENTEGQRGSPWCSVKGCRLGGWGFRAGRGEWAGPGCWGCGSPVLRGGWCPRMGHTPPVPPSPLPELRASSGAECRIRLRPRRPDSSWRVVGLHRMWKGDLRRHKEPWQCEWGHRRPGGLPITFSGRPGSLPPKQPA